MVLLRDIKGQGNAVRYLLRSLRAGRIANGYLFSGPRGVGRALCAKAFIMPLICCRRENSQMEACTQCLHCRKLDALSHPDVLWLETEGAKAIRIDRIRKIKEMLNLKPYEARIKTCVIEDAHMMTHEASNALLKILEEPPADSLLVLITDKKEMMLPTVVSRLAEVKFHFLSFIDTREILSKLRSDISAKEADFLAYFSQGSPGKAMEMLEGGLGQRRMALISLAANIVKEENILYTEWDKEEKEPLLEDIEMLIMIFRDIVFGKIKLEAMAVDKGIFTTDIYKFFKAHKIDKIYSIIENLINKKIDLANNVNPKLVAQAIPGMLRA